MKKNLLALLMGTMVVASLVVGCGAAKEEAKTDDKKTEASDDKKEDSSEDKEESKSSKKGQAKVEETSDETKEAAAVEADDVDVYYADLSDTLAGSAFVSTDEEGWVFGDDGSTFYVTDGENEIYGEYALEMLTDGEDVLMGLTISVPDANLEVFYFVTGIDTDEGVLYLLDVDGNESALVEYVVE